MKLLRTIRLDASDGFVFERAAVPGEWAVPGTFKFAAEDPRALTGRERQAFRAGFLGLTTFGWSTLAVVVEASEEERLAAVEALALHFVEHHGAPGLDEARAAAAEEIGFAAELAEHPEQTLVALHRSLKDDDTICEQFRTFHARDARRAAAMPCSAGAFAIVEEAADFSDDGSMDDTGIDLAALVAGRSGGNPGGGS